MVENRVSVAHNRDCRGRCRRADSGNHRLAQDSNTIIVIVAVGAILATVNVFIRPILQFLSCGCIIVTLGLFMLVINAGTLWLSSWMAQNWFGIGFSVDGFWPAFWGGLVISVVSFLLSIFIPEPQEENPWDY